MAKNLGNKLKVELEISEGPINGKILKKSLYDIFKSDYFILILSDFIWLIFLYLSSYLFIKLILSYINLRPYNLVRIKNSPSNFTSFVPISITDPGLIHLVAFCLLISTIICSIITHQSKTNSTKVGINVRSSLMVIIYRKALKLNTCQGEIGNTIGLIGNECNIIAEALINFHQIFSCLLQTLLLLALAFLELRLAAFPVLAMVIIFFPIQCILGYFIAKLSKSRSETTSERVYLTSEILTAIKLIKFYCWEKYFKKRISQIRKVEVNKTSQIFLCRSIMMSIVFITPILATFCSLFTFNYLYPDLGAGPELIFTILSLFNTFRYPLLILPQAVQTTKAANTSIKKVVEFLNKPEAQILKIQEEKSELDPTIKIIMSSCTFSWSPLAKPILKDLCLQIRSGKIVAIVGDVGAGKSSILSAIIGQMYLDSGTINLYGTITYSPNEPWILNASLRDNILFGRKYYSDRYRKTLRACGLVHDLRLLQFGDRTEIGDRGVSLTLGQRHRVSIARAVYSMSDVVLFDDSLSAMDPRIAKHIFRECFRNLLSTDRAVVFVTNQLQFLPCCDHIFVMKSGECVEQGTYSDLIKSDVDLKAMVGSSLEIEDPHKIDDLTIEIDNLKLEDEPEEIKTTEHKANITFSDDVSRLVTIAESKESNLSKSTNDPYKEDYVPRVSFSRTNTIEKAGSIVEPNELTISSQLKRASKIADDMTMTKIIDKNQLSVLSNSNMSQNNTAEPNAFARAWERNQYTINSFFPHDLADKFQEGEEKKSKAKFFRKVYYAYLNEYIYFVITVIILGFFISINSIRLYADYYLKLCLDSLPLFIVDQKDLQSYALIVALFFAGIFVRGILFLWITRVKSWSFHRQMIKPILMASMSFFEYTPLSKILHSFSGHLFAIDDQVSESLFTFLQFFPIVLGAVIIPITLIWPLVIPTIIMVALVIGLIYFKKGIEYKLEIYESTARSPIFSHLSSTLEGVHSIRIFGVQNRFDSFNLIKIDQANKALLLLIHLKSAVSLYIDFLASILVYISALVIIIFMDHFSLSTSDAGLALTNILQVLMYGQITANAIQSFNTAIGSVDQLTYYRSNVSSEGMSIIKDNRPDKEWPRLGLIEFNNVTLRYHRYELAVLKNVSFTIQAKDKVAIVGCTGSGKTTLLTSLLRLVEIADGNILIDGLDISTIGLKDLRSKIAVIPNEPILFFGTIRSNLDPYNTFKDEEIIKALKAVHLLDKVNSMELGLEAVIKENGIVFTYGQRQLFCIARALLLNCRILVLDEATSALDVNTDQLIQETIAKNFKDVTVLFVAHRLNTIIEADKVLVMNDGQVSEYDAPDVLLCDKESRLYSLISQNSADDIKNLQELARLKAIYRSKQVSPRGISSIATLGDSTPNSSIPRSLGSRSGMPRSLENMFS